MTFAEMSKRLRESLSRPLPGDSAHATMAPSPRRQLRPGESPEGMRRAAALLLLYPKGSEPHLVLTMRKEDLPQHPGQVSLPGGAVEPGESIEDAALREAREEVGADSSRLDVVGVLSPLPIPVSGFVVHPVVALAGSPPELRAHEREVESILEVSLADLASPPNRRTEHLPRDDGRDRVIPFFAVSGVKVWGATAMILAEFLALLGLISVR